MLKRLRWLLTGAAMGLGGSVWIQRRLRQMGQRLRPTGVASVAAGRARDALDEGRAAMRQREAELRGAGAVPRHGSSGPAPERSAGRRP